MKIKTIFKYCAAAPLLFVMGCALSPQSVHLNPKIDAQFDVIANKTLISVSATDKRANKELGTRGGTYEDSSGIVISNDAALAVKFAMSEGLSSLGFNTNDKAQNIQFDYALNSAKYWADATSLLTNTYLKIEGSVIITAGNERFEGKYSTKLSKETVNRLNEKDNEAFINQGFADHVQKILKDEKTISFLKSVKN